MVEIARDLRERAHAFEEEAHRILARHEGSKSRVISLDDTRRQLVTLSLLQDELFQEALASIERGIYRAAHVMGWAAFVDFLEQKLASDGLAKVKSLRPSWCKFGSVDEMRETIPEHQLIEAARDVGLLSKAEMKTLLGLLSKRNECAHPSSYKPGLNESLGFVSELLSRVGRLQGKSL